MISILIFDQLQLWGIRILKNLNDKNRGIIKIFKLRLKRLDDWRKSKGKGWLKKKWEITIVTIHGEEEVQELLMLMKREESKLFIKILLRNLNQEIILILSTELLKFLCPNKIILKVFLKMQEVLFNLKVGQNPKWDENRGNWKIGELNYKNQLNSRLKISEKKKNEKE